jgi:hypothetical protein
MISIERAEIGMRVLAKNQGLGKIIDFRLTDNNHIMAFVLLDSGSLQEFPLEWLSSIPGKTNERFN